MKEEIFKRVVSSLLIMLFVFAPLTPVFAEEDLSPVASDVQVSKPSGADFPAVFNKQQSSANDAGTQTEESVQQAGEGDVPQEEALQNAEVNTQSNQDPSGEVGEEQQASPNTSGQDENDIKVSNSKSISVEVDQISGSLNYRYSFALPPGRNGMNPSLALTYNSEDKNNASEFGFGWSLSIPKIERINKKGTDVVYSNADFKSSLSGELRNISGSSYGAKIDDSSFLNYQLVSDVWTVTAKDGTLYTFGATADARLFDPADSLKVHAWYVTKIQDTNGNSVDYTYFKDSVNNAVYPSAITYTNNASLQGIYSVQFIREARPDEYTNYATGFKSKINQRISEIQVLTNGAVSRKYRLNYSAGDNGARTMLGSVTETGISEAGVATVMPNAGFDYAPINNNLSFDTTIDYPLINGQPFSLLDTLRIADINGDGLKDIIKSYYGQPGGSGEYQSIFWVLKNNGHGWQIDNTWTQPSYTYINNEGGTINEPFSFDSRSLTGDWNGDGKDDLIKFWVENGQGGISTQQSVVLINTGTSWQQDLSVTVDPATYINGDGTNRVYVYSGSAGVGSFLDLNGDGMMDYIYATNYQINGIDYPTFAVWYNKNGDLVWDNTVPLPMVTPQPGGQTTPLTFGSSGVRPLDVNGDGLVDFMMASNHQINGIDYPYFWVILNNGHGWTQDSTISHPTFIYLDENNTQLTDYFITTGEWQLMDINGDRLPDWVKLWMASNVPGSGFERKSVLVNTGHGWVQNDAAIQVGNYQYIDENGGTITEYPTTAPTGTKFFFDEDGDALDDIVNIHYTQSAGVSYPRNWTMKNIGKKANLMETAITPEGGTYSFDYKATGMYRDSSGNQLNPNLPLIFDTLNAMSINDGSGNAATTTYEYANGHFYYNNQNDRYFSGFGKVTLTDPAGNKSDNYYHLGNGLEAGETEQDPSDGSLAGKNYKQELYSSTGLLMSQTYKDWASSDLGNNRDFAYQSRMVGNENGKQTAKDYAYNLLNGNLVSEVNYGKVTAVSNTFTDLGNDKRTVNYEYTTAGPVLVAAAESQDQVGARISQQKFYYDGQVLGTAVQGNATKIESWVEGQSYINSQKSYTPFGLVAMETDPRGNVTSYSYDIYHLYPLNIANQLGQETAYEYNYGLGKAKQTTDANGFVYQKTYDGLGRLAEEKVPGENPPYAPVAKTQYLYTNAPNAFSVEQREYLDDSLQKISYTYFDGLGRKIQERAATEDVVTYTVKDTVYNNLGLVAKESLPYFSQGSAKTPAAANNALYIAYGYDALKRITATTNAVGSVSNTYDNWKVTVTDANNVPKDVTYDSYQNLVQVDEHNGASIYTTAYEYNGNDKLAKVTDSQGNVRNFTYDGLSRMKTAQDLHAPSDSTFGVWLYLYDEAGNLTEKTDPNNQTINYTYDALNRVASEDYAGNAGTETAYTYDTCQNGMGKLCSVVSSGVADAYQYDSRGQISSQTKTIDASNYQTSYAYDRQGNVLTITNPDNSQIKYAHNTASQLENIQRKESADSGFSATVTDFDYGPDGQTAFVAYANGVTITNTYNQNQLYRLTNKLTVNSGSTQLQNVAYTYNANGNITQMVDSSQTDAAKTVTYAYDDLNRLLQTQITNVAPGQQVSSTSYTYDSLGNILAKSETIGQNPAVNYTYAYEGSQGSSYANPHAVTKITKGTDITNFSYDNNGNLVSENNKTFAFDYNNKLTQATPLDASTTVAFYPVAGDGSTYKTDASWATARSAASGSLANYINTAFTVKTGKATKGVYSIERAFLPFNTSSLPDNAVITDAKLKVFVTSKANEDNDGDDWVTLVQGLQPSTATLTVADYDLAGTVNNPTEGIDTAERKDITNVATGQYLVFNFNSVGKSWVSLTGSTKLALREGHDVANNPFSGEILQYNQLAINSGEASGTANDPVLEITYTVTPPPVHYSYDYQGQRAKVASQGAASHYPTNYFNTDGVTPKKHIFSNDQLITTIEGSNAQSTVHYVNPDHLKGSSVVTNAQGNQEELLDYHPYGKIRIDQKTGSFSEKRKYIGEEHDEDTGLNYLNARYYSSDIGRFISQDPVFWNGKHLALQLPDPQSWNSYSYARNNPVALADSDGEFWQEAIKVYLGASNAYATNYIFGQGRVNSSDPYFQMGQNIGDRLSLTQGALEVAAGYTGFIAGTGGGLALAPASGGASVAAGAAVNAGSATLAAHGGSLFLFAANNLDNGGKEGPKSAKNWIEPTNKPQAPNIPEGWVSEPAKNGRGVVYRAPGTIGEQNTIRVMNPTEQYPNGYWRQTNNKGIEINPSTGQPGIGTKTQVRSQTHIPLPEGYRSK